MVRGRRKSDVKRNSSSIVCATSDLNVVDLFK